MSKGKSVQAGPSPARWLIALQAGLLLAMFLLAANIPRQSVAFPFLLAAVSVWVAIAAGAAPGGLFWGTNRRFAALLAGFVIYLFLNATWSLDPQAAAGKAALAGLLIALTLATVRAYANQPGEALERAARWAVYGAVAGTLFTCFEFWSSHFVERMLYTYIPAVRPGDKTIDVMVLIDGTLNSVPESEFRLYRGDAIIRISSAALNRNLSLLMLVFWPALFLAMSAMRKPYSLLSAGLIAMASAGALAGSFSQTAQLALVLSVCVFFAARYWPLVTHRAVLGTWICAMALALPLSIAPFWFGLHTSEWLPSSFRDRVTIWAFTVEQTVKNPVEGIGIRSTRVRGKELKGTQPKPEDYVRPKRLGLHAHNQFLQVWFELGAVGAAFVLVIGIGLIQAMGRLHAAFRPYAYAAFVAACIVAAFGFGLWQSWLMSGYALATMLAGFANARAAAGGNGK